MKRQEFEILLKKVKSEIGGYEDGYSVAYIIEDCYRGNIEPSDLIEEVDENILDQGRWTITKEAILKIADNYYIAVVWDDPATEGQEGQETNCQVYEVEPYEETVVKYRMVK